MATASGTFTVVMKPGITPSAADGVTLAHMTLEKSFQGDLNGTGRGNVLTAMTATPGSAGYVAMERFEGTLHGKAGSFVFQHSSTMDRGKPVQSVAVVPDSGTGELAGISGRLEIHIDGKEHVYSFAYTLPGGK